MDVWNHGNDRIVFDDATNRYRFIMDDHIKVEITDTSVRVFDARDEEVFNIDASGGVHIQRDKLELATVGNNYMLQLGRGFPGDGRGRVEVHNQPEQGHSGEKSYMPKEAGILVLYDERGTRNFLWVDTGGKLRISRSDPEANDLSGTVVGTQS